MAGVWQPCWAGHGERGLPSFCFIPSGKFVSSGMTAASREQPCRMLKVSVLQAQPLANPKAPLHLQGTPNSAQAGREVEQAGGRRWHSCPRGSRAGDLRGQLGRRLCRKHGQSICSKEVVPHLSLVPAAGAWEQPDPQGPQKGQQRWSKEATGAGQVLGHWGLPSAWGWGPAQLRHPGLGDKTVWGSAGTRRNADSGLCGRAGPSSQLPVASCQAQHPAI